MHTPVTWLLAIQLGTAASGWGRASNSQPVWTPRTRPYRRAFPPETGNGSSIFPRTELVPRLARMRGAGRRQRLSRDYLISFQRSAHGSFRNAEPAARHDRMYAAARLSDHLMH